MDYIHALILSVIEGVTEFLPISSTGHLILANKILGIESSDFVKTFEISIQLGAIFSIVLLYWRTLLKDFEYLKKVIIAFIPTGILGFAFYKLVKDYLLESPGVTLVALVIGGLLLIFIERLFKNKYKEGDVQSLSYRRALGIGFFQSLSMIPGVSRSAATIIGGMMAGLKRESAAEFSFVLAVPTMMAATGYDLLKNYQSFDSKDFGVLGFGFVVSFIVALIVVKWFLGYVKNNSLTSFGVYRILLAIAFFLLVY